ncbi:MAG: hypothetical protein ACKVKQ_02200, partial [Flavobacteriales bacterium]
FLKLFDHTNNKKNIKMKKIILKWYPVILAFLCLLYSVGYGIMGMTEEAQYSAHWPGTILLFAIAIRQRRTT